MGHMQLGSATTEYTNQYDKGLLFPIARQPQRAEHGIEPNNVPFAGRDLWNAYEFTYLTPQGKPTADVLQIEVPFNSSAIIESKSMKLYLGSFAGTRFEGLEAVIECLERDLTAACEGLVQVRSVDPEPVSVLSARLGAAHCLDDEAVGVPECGYSPATLSLASSEVAEVTYYSDLFRSLCPMTGQPDFARIILRMTGPQLARPGLLQYLFSYREHGEFAEQVAERLFMDLYQAAKPSKLGVRAEVTRRGGIDINAERVLGYHDWDYVRHYRQ